MTTRAALQTIHERLTEAASELGSVVCRIPGDKEEEVGLAAGLAWVDRSVTDGLAVDYRIVPDPGGEGGEIWLMHWDPSEPKPPWAEDWEDDEPL